MTVKEPTAEECNDVALVAEDDEWKYYAAWYPSMGGYVGKCVIQISKADPSACIEVSVWHDGEFPFKGDDEWRGPVRTIHHCCPEDFIFFGRLITRLQGVEVE